MLNCVFPVNNSQILYFLQDASGMYSLRSCAIDGTGSTTLDVFDSKYIMSDYLCTNSDGTIICYALFDGSFASSVYIRSFDGTTLGPAVEFPTEGTSSRFKFGRIDQALFSALPLLSGIL